MLRTEDRGGYSDADGRWLARLAERLAVLLARLHERGVAVVPGDLPVLVPLFGTEPRAPGVRGVPGVPGSTGMSDLYSLRRTC
ncbi:hypothetical protein AB0N88_05345 [Streptomyces sp. NPDC093516]|uniref:hypothetical protein n=1 Tax=Streptomyces sp. NPDC093516 TaxID=3155304 RepID=UPI0034191856